MPKKEERKNLVETHPQVAIDWDYEKNYPLTPEMFTYGSKEEVFWKCHVCKIPHESYSLSIKRRVNLNSGCLIKYHDKSDKSLAKRFPNVAKYWDEVKNYPLKASDVSATSHNSAWFICPKCKEPYYVEIANRVVRKHPECNACQGKVPKHGETDLKADCKEIADCWDYEANYPKRPEQFLPQSNKPAHWICAKCGHHYPMRIQSRVLKGKNYTCPVCTNRELKIGVNDFVTTCKKKGLDIYKEWDYEKNGDKRPENYFSNYAKEKFYWHCYNTKYRPHDFYMSIADRYNGNGCNVCTNMVLLQGVNDLEIVCQDRGLDIIKDWDWKNNGNKTPNTTKAGGLTDINWLCHKCGYKWTTSVSNRMFGYGCPACTTSKGEQLIQSILKRWKLPFQIGFSITDNITPYPFDCYVESPKLLIEYDGRQHFMSIEWFDKTTSFKERKRRDNVRNSCAFINKIPLLRIPYTYDPFKNKADIERLLKEFIQTKKIPQEIIDFYAQYEFSNYAKLAREWNAKQTA